MANDHGQIAHNMSGAFGAWQIANLPNSFIWITDIHCLSTTDCWAIGDKGILRNITGAVGDWTIANYPAGYVANQGSFTSLHCTGSADCWFLYGDKIIRNTTGAINGARFIASPYPDASGNTYGADIFCTNSTDCWIVGSSFGEVLIAHNSIGGDNDFVKIDLGGLEGSLSKVTCTSSTNCWAIGPHGLIMRNKTGADNGWYVVNITY